MRAGIPSRLDQRDRASQRSRDVRLVTVTQANRDGLLEEQERWARERLRSRWRVPCKTRSGASNSPKKTRGLVNLPLGALVYQMSATETPSGNDQSSAPASEAEGMMIRSHANFCGHRTPTTAQAESLRRALTVYPLRQ